MDPLTKARLSRDSFAGELRDLDRIVDAHALRRAELVRQLAGLDGYIQALEEMAKDKDEPPAVE